MEVARVATSATAKKKRKVNTNGESVELPSSYAQLKKPRRLVVSGASKIAAAEGVREADEDVSTSDHVETSCCSSNGSSELVHDGDIKFVDLKVNDLIEVINFGIKFNYPLQLLEFSVLFCGAFIA